MEVMQVHKNRIYTPVITAISYLFILLFTYTAVSKLLDFENFEVQLGQSPMLSAFAGWISWSVLGMELLVSGFLVFDRTRRLGLYLSFILMVMFTTYILIILNFSSFVPCSCGGVLEKMNWTEHLIFNFAFLLLAILALLLEMKSQDFNTAKTRRLLPLTKRLFGYFFGGVFIVTALYWLSEEEISRNNSFLRRYPPHPVTVLKGKNIKYNTYYIAGVAEDRIYLGNTSAPAHMLSVDTTLSDVKTHLLEVDNEQQITFYSPQIRIHAPYFFLMDGDVPAIFKGTLQDWKATLVWQGDNTTNFSQMEVVTPDRFVFRGVDRQNNQNSIGSIDLVSSNSLKATSTLLQKQLDGIFDTDGMLLYNADLSRLVYIYYYRNEYVTAFPDLTLDYNGRTIDTVKSASLKIALTNENRVRTLAERPLIVNHQGHTSNKYLFIKSDRLGKYEPEEMLKDASIIDVYNLVDRTYEFSFYLYDYKREKIKSFQIYRNILIGLTEHHIVVYRLQPLNFDLKPVQNKEINKNIRPYQGKIENL